MLSYSYKNIIGFSNKKNYSIEELIENYKSDIDFFKLSDDRDNYDIVLQLVKFNGFAIQYISDRLKNFPIIIRDACLENNKVYTFTNDELKKILGYTYCEFLNSIKRLNNDVNFAVECVKKNGLILSLIKLENIPIIYDKLLIMKFAFLNNTPQNSCF